MCFIMKGLSFLFSARNFNFSFPLQEHVKHQTRFLSKKPAKVVLSSMEVVAQSMGFKTHIRNYKVKTCSLGST